MRSGVSSFTAANTHHDGGFSSAGVFSICGASYLRVDGDGPQEPNARWEWNYQGCTWTDHAGWWAPIPVIAEVTPALPETQILVNVNFVESQITDSVGLDPGGSRLDSASAVFTLAQGSCLIERGRFERNGIFDSGAVGDGGVAVITPAGGSTVPIWEFTDVEFHTNAAGQGAGIYASFGK